MDAVNLLSKFYICNYCSKFFNGRKRKYCSKRCSIDNTLAKNKDKAKALRLCVCVTCKKDFYGTRKNQRFCSGRCRSEYGNKYAHTYGPFICLRCQTSFTTGRKTDGHVFCSRACSDKHGRLARVKTYTCLQCSKDFVSVGNSATRCLDCRNARKPVYDRQCSICMVSFRTKDAEKLLCRLCLYKKGLEDKLKPFDVLCKQCNKPFIRQKRQYSICRACIQNSKTLSRRLSKQKRRHFIRARRKGERFIHDEIFKRDKWRCQLCKRKVSRRHNVVHDLYPHLDHIVPLSRGGIHSRTNVQTLCRRCNVMKSATILPNTQMALL